MPEPGKPHSGALVGALLLPVALLASGCDDDGDGVAGPDPEVRPTACGDALDPPARYLSDGRVAVVASPALNDPPLVAAGDPGAAFVADTNRVVGLLLDGAAVAIPENALWWHNIVNLSSDSGTVSVTRSNLAGATRVYGPDLPGGGLGSSGVLFQTNEIVARASAAADARSFWLQPTGEPVCLPATTTTARRLPLYPAAEMTWAGWRALHPDTRVVSSDTGLGSDFTRFPFGDFNRIDNPDVLGFAGPPLDPRRPPKELILGFERPDSSGVAYPLGELGEEPVRAFHFFRGPLPAAVFWRWDVGAANAFIPIAGGRELHFTVRDGEIVDEDTGSVWTVDGLAVSGRMTGQRLPIFSDAIVRFWYAWAWARPRTEIWLAGDG